MGPAWGFRLALATLMIGLGFVIIGRSLWIVFTQGLALSTLFLPIGVGILMIALGISRWRDWIRGKRG
ncbi:MAG: hypothetical protein ACK4OK_04785 [Thermoflexus sp.]